MPPKQLFRVIRLGFQLHTQMCYVFENKESQTFTPWETLIVSNQEEPVV